MTSILATMPGAGWRPLTPDHGFQDLVGPMFRATEVEVSAIEPLRLGFRVAQKHCNSGGVCHGGMLATFMDQALGMAVFESVGNPVFTPTVNLSIDFIRPAFIDQWLESRLRVTHMTDRAGYCDGVIQGPQGLIVRAHGVFRLATQAPARR